MQKAQRKGIFNSEHKKLPKLKNSHLCLLSDIASVTETSANVKGGQKVKDEEEFSFSPTIQNLSCNLDEENFYKHEIDKLKEDLQHL